MKPTYPTTAALRSRPFQRLWPFIVLIGLPTLALVVDASFGFSMMSYIFGDTIAFMQTQGISPMLVLMAQSPGLLTLLMLILIVRRRNAKHRAPMNQV
jgi:hypothetical protein